MEVISSSETLVTTCTSTRCYSPEGHSRQMGTCLKNTRVHFSTCVCHDLCQNCLDQHVIVFSCLEQFTVCVLLFLPVVFTSHTSAGTIRRQRGMITFCLANVSQLGFREHPPRCTLVRKTPRNLSLTRCGLRSGMD
jgi:hypothetical protein